MQRVRGARRARGQQVEHRHLLTHMATSALTKVKTVITLLYVRSRVFVARGKNDVDSYKPHNGERKEINPVTLLTSLRDVTTMETKRV